MDHHPLLSPQQYDQRAYRDHIATAITELEPPPKRQVSGGSIPGVIGIRTDRHPEAKALESSPPSSLGCANSLPASKGPGFYSPLTNSRQPVPINFTFWPRPCKISSVTMKKSRWPAPDCPMASRSYSSMKAPRSCAALPVWICTPYRTKT